MRIGTTGVGASAVVGIAVLCAFVFSMVTARTPDGPASAADTAALAGCYRKDGNVIKIENGSLKVGGDYEYKEIRPAELKYSREIVIFTRTGINYDASSHSLQTRQLDHAIYIPVRGAKSSLYINIYSEDNNSVLRMEKAPCPPSYVVATES